ncbi:AraC family transcriptional regulator [Paraburkholderia lacunae]|uniref:HTH araC/xylS-type domain-containing protein n=1 Tax=Paraburkholderia lacunae TaxID=2211104 RepID=A0A370NCA1_9BURK|nr:AraC family transcriptional regulator [Paraburkholderia lacunae]RDK03205.1 hypothetical protein DLM46_10015 [Paraburkholderia lacunae]
MARKNVQNSSEFWSLPSCAGIEFLHAHYNTHTFPRHVHDQLVIGMTEHGAGYFTSNNRNHVATRNTLIVFNPDEPHSGGVAPGTQWRYRALYLSPSEISRLSLEITESSKVRYFRNNNVADPALAAYAARIHCSSRSSAGRLALESRLVSLLAQIIHRHGDPAPRIPKCGNEHSAVKRIKDYIRGYFPTDIALGDLAALTRMSEYQVLRAFKKETGLTPHAYLNQVRLSNSKRLISAGLTLTDVANDVGFFDQSHLIRLFKQSYGFTPGQYARAAAVRAV